MLELIVITAEKSLAHEARLLTQLFERGLSTLHLRKPDATEDEVRALIAAIHPDYHSRIVLHDHFRLCCDFRLKGVHLNRRNPSPPEKGATSVSASCHTIKELSALAHLDYLFLSPIFDSISKVGYSQGFSAEELSSAAQAGIINKKVIALGGITPDTAALAAQYGFGGVAVLGWLWGNYEKDKDEVALLHRFTALKSKCNIV